MREMIDVTGVDLVSLAQKVYELSLPQGLGLFHFTPKPLSEVEEIVDACINDKRCALFMDYVHGRACKFTVFRKDGKLIINNSWYDHTDSQFNKLIETFGFKAEKLAEHGCACNCFECQTRQRQKAGVV
jgi:hypothetical protein